MNRIDGRKLFARFGTRRLAGYALLLLFAVGIVQVVASLLFYEAIDRQTVREDHARRVAELLVVSDRLYSIDPAITARIMSTRHLEVTVTPAPAIARQGTANDAREISHHILDWEPVLGGRQLAIDVARGKFGKRDLVGSMRLQDGAWLNFRSIDISSGWPIALRAAAITLVITLLSMAIAAYALRRLMAPLRWLEDAADAMDHGRMVPVREGGPADLRHLARSFNDMQTRISGLVDDQAKSFEAISHDLRTPLSRLKLAADFVSDSDVAKIVGSSADEMEALLASLQRFLRAEHLEAEAEPIDIVAETRSVIAAHAGAVMLVAPDAVMLTSYREPLLLALDALIENALAYGREAQVTIASDGDDWIIAVADDGPGIPQEYFGRILDPFFRLDTSRPRDTAGFGLGIPTAHRLLTRFGGALSFANRAEGGLIARITVPRADQP
jgi:two-component system osmolarity sensor histidine kinase EnvZ